MKKYFVESVAIILVATAITVMGQGQGLREQVEGKGLCPYGERHGRCCPGNPCENNCPGPNIPSSEDSGSECQNKCMCETDYYRRRSDNKCVQLYQCLEDIPIKLLGRVKRYSGGYQYQGRNRYLGRNNHWNENNGLGENNYWGGKEYLGRNNYWSRNGYYPMGYSSISPWNYLGVKRYSGGYQYPGRNIYLGRNNDWSESNLLGKNNYWVRNNYWGRKGYYPKSYSSMSSWNYLVHQYPLPPIPCPGPYSKGCIETSPNPVALERGPGWKYLQRDGRFNPPPFSPYKD